MLISDLFKIFEKYEYQNPKSNASNLDRYLRGLCKCMIDKANEKISFELINTIFRESEYYGLVEYDPEWEDLLPVDLDEHPEKGATFETAITMIKGLIGEGRKIKRDYRERLEASKEQLEKLGLKSIPFYQYQGNFAYWNNFSPASIIYCLQSCLTDSRGENIYQEFDKAEIRWYLIPDLLITGIMYE